jgi:acrylyl-CoA reductase (NADPH)
LKTIKAIQLNHPSSGIHAEYINLPLSILPSREVLIKVEYSSINYKDYLAISGLAPIARTLPLLAGIDFSGCVLKSTSENYTEGDYVIGVGSGLSEVHNGGYASVVWEDADNLVRLPEGMSTRDAMIFGTAGFTAMLATRLMRAHLFEVNSKLPYLVTGASGGVGSIASLILSRQNLEVHAMTRKLSHTSFFKRLGVDSVKNYDELTLSHPLNKVRYAGAIDNLGGTILSSLLTVMSPWSSVVCVGLTSDPHFQSTVYPFILRGVQLKGIHLDVPSDLKKIIWQSLYELSKEVDINHLVDNEITFSDVLKTLDDYKQKVSPGRILINLKDA